MRNRSSSSRAAQSSGPKSLDASRHCEFMGNPPHLHGRAHAAALTIRPRRSLYMKISRPVAAPQTVRAFRPAIIVLGALAFVSVANVSAHFVKGLGPSGSTSAFVSSPSDGTDPPIQVKWGSLPAGDTGLRVA